jgi:hypothetical protein
MRREWFDPFETSMSELGVAPVWLGESFNTVLNESWEGLDGVVVELSSGVIGPPGLPDVLESLPVAGVPVEAGSEALAKSLGITNILSGEEQARSWLDTLALPKNSPAPLLIAVWGTAGAPGATTLAVGLALHIAQYRPTVLIDADFVAPSAGELLNLSGDYSGLLGALRVARNDNPSWDSVVACATPVIHHDSLRVLAGVRPGSLGRVEAGSMSALLGSALAQGVAIVVELKCSLGSPEASPEKVAVEAILGAAHHLYLVGNGGDLGVSRMVREWNLLPPVSTDFGRSLLVRAPHGSRDPAFSEASTALWNLTGCSDIRLLPEVLDVQDTSRCAELLDVVDGGIPHRPPPTQPVRRGLREALAALLTTHQRQPLP